MFLEFVIIKVPVTFVVEAGLIAIVVVTLVQTLVGVVLVVFVGRAALIRIINSGATVMAAVVGRIVVGIDLSVELTGACCID